jgi:polyhydroxybutyrate depolymerase
MPASLRSGIPLVVVAALVAALALLATGAGSSSRPAPPAVTGPPAPNPCSRPPVPGSTGLTVASGGLVRAAVLHLPPGRKAHVRMPLIVALHGAGGSGRKMEPYSGFSKLADSAGFVVVYPSAVPPHPRWNIYENPAGPDDVAFIRDLLARVENVACIDRRSVYAAGVSNGGGMAALLACQLSDEIAAVAAVAGAYADLPDCQPPRPVSLLEIHGTADTTVPYGGRSGEDTDTDSVLSFVQSWIERDGCPGEGAQQAMAPDAIRYAWGPCAAGTAVQHIKILGGTHAWPGATPPDPGPPTTVNATREAWGFFQGRHPALSSGP